jgi:hypothetical protein
MVMVVREEHPWKAQTSIVVTPSGMVMAVREEHPWKAQTPIVVTPSGMVMAVREEHPLKAAPSIVVTPSGIMMDVREEHLSKASSPIDVTPCAKVTSVSSRSQRNVSLPEYTADLGILGGDSPGIERIFSRVYSVTVESPNYLILILYEFLHY